jgi:hypothetical protein
MTLKKCHLCGNYKYSFEKVHICPPAWFVWQEGEEPEEFNRIYADSEKQAIDRYLAPILSAEFDTDVRTIFILPSQSNYFDDQEELLSVKETLLDIQEALKEGTFFEYYEEGEKQLYEDKVTKLTASIKSESEKIKKFEVEAYFDYQLNFKEIKTNLN